MKNIKKVVFAVAVLVFLFTAISCDLLFGPTEYDYKFINRSSYTVTVGPNGQEGWLQFMMGPGDTRTITIEDDYIYYWYFPANYVRASGVTGTFTFYDI